MKSARFGVMGFARSLWDFYQGFGLSISVMLLALGVVLWQLGAIARTDYGRVRPVVVVLLVAFIAISALDGLYFFTAPLALSIGITVSLALSLGSGSSPMK